MEEGEGVGVQEDAFQTCRGREEGREGREGGRERWEGKFV